MKKMNYIFLIFLGMLFQGSIFAPGEHDNNFGWHLDDFPTYSPHETVGSIVEHRGMLVKGDDILPGDHDFVGEHNILSDEPVRQVDGFDPVDSASSLSRDQQYLMEQGLRDASNGDSVVPAPSRDVAVAANPDAPVSSADGLSTAKSALDALGVKIGGSMNTEEQDKKNLQDQSDDQKVMDSIPQRKTPSLVTRVMAYIRSKIYSKKQREAYVSQVNENIKNIQTGIDRDQLKLVQSNMLSEGDRDKLTPAAKLSLQREIVWAKEYLVDYQHALKVLTGINNQTE